MSKKNRDNISYPKSFMKWMKKKKSKKIRNTPVDKKVIEQKFNDASRVI
jgi:hypothetical protein